MHRTLCLVLTLASTVVLSENVGCRGAGIGDPCIPEREYETTFAGFSETEVSVESKSFQCQTRTCLVNHFRGRVSCPNGQTANGAECTTPGAGDVVAPNRPEPLANCVPAQCTDRAADDAVYCSCRCANLAGRTDDGALYCDCPEAYACEELVSSIGGGRSEGLTGRYCVKKNTEFRDESNCQATLDDTTKNCVQ